MSTRDRQPKGDSWSCTSCVYVGEMSAERIYLNLDKT